MNIIAWIITGSIGSGFSIVLNAAVLYLMMEVYSDEVWVELGLLTFTTLVFKELFFFKSEVMMIKEKDVNLAMSFSKKYSRVLLAVFAFFMLLFVVLQNKYYLYIACGALTASISVVDISALHQSSKRLFGLLKMLPGIVILLCHFTTYFVASIYGIAMTFDVFLVPYLVSLAIIFIVYYHFLLSKFSASKVSILEFILKHKSVIKYNFPTAVIITGLNQFIFSHIATNASTELAALIIKIYRMMSVGVEAFNAIARNVLLKSLQNTKIDKKSFLKVTKNSFLLISLLTLGLALGSYPAFWIFFNEQPIQDFYLTYGAVYLYLVAFVYIGQMTTVINSLDKFYIVLSVYIFLAILYFLMFLSFKNPEEWLYLVLSALILNFAVGLFFQVYLRIATSSTIDKDHLI